MTCAVEVSKIGSDIMFTVTTTAGPKTAGYKVAFSLG
jgi:hypothetical protein